MEPNNQEKWTIQVELGADWQRHLKIEAAKRRQTLRELLVDALTKQFGEPPDTNEAA